MKQTNKSIGTLSIIILLFSFTLGSCGKMDDTYRGFLSDGETVYVGKADSLKIRSGRERIELEWLVMADPKVKNYKVYWNNRTDSIENTINREKDGDTVRLMIDNLPGGVYEFEIFQFGSEGKGSVRSSVIGRSYDNKYEDYLPNRAVESSLWWEIGETTVNWIKYNNPEMVGIDLSYTSVADKQVNIVVPPNQLKTILEDFKPDTEIRYRTMFKPDSLALDTFYSVYSTFIPETLILQGDASSFLLKNYKVPFQRLDSWDGSRWGTVSDWTVSDGAKINCINGNCYGSWDGHSSAERKNTMSVQRWNTEPAALNAKIYQTMLLPPGRYRFSLKLVEKLTNTGPSARYIMVNAGSTLPDIIDVESALAYESFQGTAIKAATTTFVLTENTLISLGILFHFDELQNVFNIESFKLEKDY